MALTLPQALQRLPQGIMSGIAKSIVTTDEMSYFLPIQAVQGDSVRFIREGSLPVGGAFINDAGVTTEESTGTDDRTTVEFRRLVGNMDVDEFANALSGGAQQGVQLAKKVKATWRLVSDKLINGGRTTSHTITPAAGSPGAALGAATYSPWLDSDRRGLGSIKYTHTGTFWSFRAPGDPDFGTPVAVPANATVQLKSYNQSKWIKIAITAASATADGMVHIAFNSSTNEFDGIEQICDPSMLIDPTGANGDDYSFAMLDRLLTTVKVRNSLAFFMPSKLIEKHYGLCRALGGTTPEYCNVPFLPGVQVPAYRGKPLLINDFVPADETVGSTTDASSIYLASMDEAEGLSLAAASFGGESQSVEGDPRSREVFGWRIQDVGLLEGKDARRTRVSFYGAPVLKSVLALGRRRGVKTT